MRRHARRRRRGRNAPYGSTSAEFAQVNRRPKKVRGSGGRSGVLLGSLDELVVCTPRGNRTISDSKVRNLFVLWMPGSNNLAIAKKMQRNRYTRADLTEQDARVFEQFHKSTASKVGTYDWPDRAGPLRKLGRLRSLTYIVPKWVKSLEKWNYKWVHAFGDHGESGHGLHTGTKSYPQRLMPMLCKDKRGNLHIVRQPGNRYNVSEWIYW